MEHKTRKPLKEIDFSTLEGSKLQAEFNAALKRWEEVKAECLTNNLSQNETLKRWKAVLSNEFPTLIEDLEQIAGFQNYRFE